MKLSDISSAHHSGLVSPEQEELAGLHSLLDFVVEEEPISKEDKAYIISAMSETDKLMGMSNKIIHLKDVALWVTNHAGGISYEIKSSLKRAVTVGLRF